MVQKRRKTVSRNLLAEQKGARQGLVGGMCLWFVVVLVSMVAVAGSSVDEAAIQFMDAVRSYDEAALTELVDDQIVIRGLQQTFEEFASEKEAKGGITADLPYIIERWFHVPQGVTFRFEIAGQGWPIGSGKLAVRGPQWFQTLPEQNAVGEKLWIHTLLTHDRTYIWNERLGVGAAYPPCPPLLVLGDMLAVIPYGREVFQAAGGRWTDRPDGAEAYPSPEVTIQDQPAVSAVVWDYVWPFHHDPEIEMALVVAVSYPDGDTMETGGDGRVDPSLSEPLWTEQLSLVTWYFGEQETRTYYQWEMLSGADPSLFLVPAGIEWDVWGTCPEPDKAPIWWEWGVSEASWTE